jgi:hypothetical protein
MRILEQDGDSAWDQRLRYLRADLEALQANEIASFWVTRPKTAERVEHRGLSLSMASDRGLFGYEITAGWNEPFTPVEGPPGEPWNIEGWFLPWSKVVGLSVKLGTDWVEQESTRRSRRSLRLDHPALDLPEPRAGWNMPGSDQAAWRDFVRACLELLAADAGAE